ncbi:hypothetical protein HME9302_01140 [Alteripontixanthobacter maritimus]|uniref:PNPLA domain-containing protein n=1 Tax=Alteripontixanthobacter maritimus TaxID=2161824 RepID=A0A369Q4W7_9SPHN|nr:patatin-like protein [Alteripontixanthobacter maritimus]RDC59943.1 hypothetical protein HME9302_01140 [Alteripontixanthobacter maritimus]
MRQKELRIALVCYGGVSLAVYMHGVTKELWHLARASRDYHGGLAGSERPAASMVYSDILQRFEDECDLRLRVLPDILTGASAGGINAVFLAQAVHSGQSLDPLTDLWLDLADVEELTHPDARPMWRFAKFWAQPIASWLLRRPGNAVSDSVAPETRAEVRRKVSRLVRGRWFSPPFSGGGFARLLARALDAMKATPDGAPLLPPGHTIDLMVTTTDFRGHPEVLELNSPPRVLESEHRLPVNFRSKVPAAEGHELADPLELTFAARATASFPGAFPPMQIAEIDSLAFTTGREWGGREAFLQRIMPVHVRRQTLDTVALIDGSVLVNAPFASAIEALPARTAQREVDRRFVYIDPRPDRNEPDDEPARPIGFFRAIFGSLSTIPREQPIRDNLEVLEKQSHEARRLQRIMQAMRPDVERSVDKLFGRTLFLDKPTTKRLANWRNRAQQAAATSAGFAFHPYAQAKFTAIVEGFARTIRNAAPALADLPQGAVAARLHNELATRGLTTLADPSGGASEEAVAFFRAHDVNFRVRRLQSIVRRLSREWEADPDLDDEAVDTARTAIHRILAIYHKRSDNTVLGDDFAAIAETVLDDPAGVLEALGERRRLIEADTEAEEKFAAALEAMPRELRRRALLAYLGFPFYDVATLPLLRSEGLTEFDPVKVDRISPDDATSIREGGTNATLRGIEFYNFGAFFSRAYRENDYLWGRLHGAERMIDLLVSTVPDGVSRDQVQDFKRAAFQAILDEEEPRLRANPGLVGRLRREMTERMGPMPA